MDIHINKGRIEGEITPPCSKSYAQRALAVSLLAQGQSTLRNMEFCDDTLSAMRCVEALGGRIEQLSPSSLRVDGGLNPLSDSLFIGESGLSTRLFTPLASLCDRAITINGCGSILKRPMDMMIAPLRALGVRVNDNNGYLPIEVCGKIRGGEVRVDGSVSSQFITGLLLSLPLAAEDTTLFVDRAVSTPYLDMTIDVAKRFGVEISHSEYREFFVEGGQKYVPTDYSIEGDWSGASVIVVAGAIAGSVKVHNLSLLSKQADTAICNALVRAGAEVESDNNSITVSHRELNAFEFDATHCPDLFPALVALAAACDGESKLRGTSRLLHKESNRALTLQQEYAKLGIEITLEGDDLMIVKGGDINSARCSSHNDHRIAMSLAASALRCEGQGVTIEGAECVAKSYPRFFEELESITK